MSSIALKDLPWRRSCSGSESFFASARERYHIMLRRNALQSRPWSQEPVFNQYRFCNVFREDDRTTKWFRENVRNPLRNDAVKVTLSTVVFRWFNRIETGELLLDMLQAGEWNEELVRRRLTGINPIVTGAYMIKTPARMSKLDGLIWCINWFVREGMHHDITHNLGSHRLEGVHQGLMECPYLGEFMAYEVVTDLRHTCVLNTAFDIDSWCSLGPGATRGLGWVLNGDPGTFDRHKKGAQAMMLQHCRALLEKSRSGPLWPSSWPRWEMREVEHWLCEYDKLLRGVRNERLKRRYP